jgi:hypothetical protein
MKKEKKEEVDLNTFLALYQNNEIERIVVKNNQILQGY